MSRLPSSRLPEPSYLPRSSTTKSSPSLLLPQHVHGGYQLPCGLPFQTPVCMCILNPELPKPHLPPYIDRNRQLQPMYFVVDWAFDKSRR
jgi:hypothetical protein